MKLTENGAEFTLMELLALSFLMMKNGKHRKHDKQKKAKIKK